MPRRRRKRKSDWLRRIALALLAVPALYLIAAFIGSLISVNRNWSEAEQGTTIYLVSNGIHADLILPAKTQGLDWRPLLPLSDFAAPDTSAQWVAFGAGERRVYLDTPRWRDIKPRTIWAALTGGERVMHVEWVSDPGIEARAIRLRPEEYRRLWAAIRAGFLLDRQGRPQRIDHPGYGPQDAFYLGVGKTSAIKTCNSWVGERLRLAGIKTGAWSPFAQGLLWRYRLVDQST
ncbi:MAG TPA: TIGR02117 family protein [Sphingomicrobium sp.]|nr:TIGR02117 family protein [Sphingomicrobium sp.]